MGDHKQTILQTWKERAEQLKKEVYALYLAYRDPRTPWYGKVFAALVIAYAFSPIDLIPDPIPILGYLDDLILVPLGVVIALKMIPAEVMADSRLKAEEAFQSGKLPVSWVGAALVGAIWIALAVVAVIITLRLLRGLHQAPGPT
ncbi:MAG: YkvA family protein [Chloroflexota bacterium]